MADVVVVVVVVVVVGVMFCCCDEKTSTWNILSRHSPVHLLAYTRTFLQVCVCVSLGREKLHHGAGGYCF
jgi:hypothetical protein